MGLWYEYANVFEVYQIGSKCVRTTYTAVLQRMRLISLKNKIALEAWLNAALSWLSAAQPHLTCMQNFRVCSAL